MHLEVITRKDLDEFGVNLISQFKQLLETQSIIREDGVWIRTEDVMALLKISERTLRRLRKDGSVTYRRIGGKLFYDSAQFSKLLNKRREKL